MSQSELEKAEAQGFEEYFKLSYKFRTANMICFDFEGKIKKYDSPEAIVEDFYPVRLAYYQKRKVRILGPQCPLKLMILAELPRTGAAELSR